MSRKNNAYVFMDDNTLKCRLINDGKLEELNHKKTKEFLKFVDIGDYNIKFKNRRIVLTDKYNMVSIGISNDVLMGKYNFLLSRTIEKIEELAKEYMKEKYRRKKVIKGAINGVLKKSAPVAAILIAISLFNKPSETNTIAEEPIPIENMDENEDLSFFESIDNYNEFTNKKIEATLNEIREKSKKEEAKEKIAIDETKEMVNESVDEKRAKENKIEEEPVIEEEPEVVETHYSEVDLPIEDLSNEEDVIELREKYGEFATNAQKKWGIDSRILLGMLTQESRGVGDRIMQITFDQIDDYVMDVYNFEKEKYMKVVFTNNPGKYAGKVDMTISEEELKNPKTQISAAAMLMNFNNLTDYNPIMNVYAMVDQYNKGITLFSKVLDATPGTRESILSNPDDLSFIDHENAISAGDPRYVYNTLRYADTSGGPFVVYTFNKDKDGNKYPVKIEASINKTLSKTL